MYPASDAAVVVPRARMVFEDRIQIKAACSEALCCTLVFPIPSHDYCAKLLVPSYAPTSSRLTNALRRRSRSLVDATPDHQGPDDPRHLVGQRDPHQHRRLARQHPA